MNLSDPGLLFSGFFISMIGLALFVYGKKMDKMQHLGAGLAMMVFPIFVSSLLWMWVIAAACVAGVFFLPDGS